jgi:formylglycine-generating enzyme required for sulfatase activity
MTVQGRAAARWLAGTIVLALLTVWGLQTFRLPLARRAGALNQGRTWDFNSRVDSKGVEQVWVPAGCFEMGSSLTEDLGTYANETPRHPVCISSGFWLDRFEVTNESFLRFAREGGYRERRYWSEEGWRIHAGGTNPHPGLKAFSGARQPRVKISWYEAQAYSAWRRGRLPTEAEWEWAARGPDSRRYPWGESFEADLSNTDHIRLRCTRPVGSYPAGRSWCGAQDMAGNVAEWVADGYDATAYHRAPLMDPFTPPNGPFRIVRGGAWGGITGGGAGDVRAARRAGFGAEHRKNSHGARVMHPAS